LEGRVVGEEGGGEVEAGEEGAEREEEKECGGGEDGVGDEQGVG
jgi:hypothetical protein